MFSGGNVFTEAFRNVENAIYPCFFQQVFSFFHIRTMRLDMHIGACINRTDKLAAECRVAVVYYRYGHFAYHFIGINKGIYQRVGQRDKQEENQYALVFENDFQFLLAYMEETCKALLYGLF